MNKFISQFIIVTFLISACAMPARQTSTSTSVPSITSPPTKIPPTGTATSTAAPSLTPTLGKFLIPDFFGAGDCLVYPIEAQLGDDSFLSTRNSLYGCVNVGSLPPGVVPNIELSLSGTEDGSIADLVWWGNDEVFRKQATGSDVNDSMVIYNPEKGVVEFRIGLSSAGLSQTQPVTINSLELTPYFSVSLEPTGDPIVELGEILASYRHQKDDRDSITQGAPSRSPLAEHFDVPKGWDARVVGPKPRFQNLWGILQGEGSNYYLLLDGTLVPDMEI